MKAIAICGSARVSGNTEVLLQQCLDKLESNGVDGELIRLAEQDVAGCLACNKCFKAKDGKCSGTDDDFGPIYEKMIAADIIVVGSPVYFGSATPEIMALLDRAGYVSRANDHMLSRKIGGPIVVARRAGQNFTYAQLMMWYMLNDMVVVGSTYWNIAFGMKRGEVTDDTEGVETIDRFAENLAWLCRLTNDD